MLAQTLATLSRFTDDDVPLETDEVSAARTFFTAWAAELRRDAPDLHPEM